jgi:biotin-[acetyl-CoA-carboxylase] ligase BirA-like protein
VRETVRELAEALAHQVENVAMLEVAASTHAIALALIEQMDAEGMELESTLLIAGRQTQGKGRGNRVWTSPQGGLYLNWLCSRLDRDVVIRLPMIAAASAHGAVTTLGVDGLRIKWPNDLLVRGAKLGGILVHARHAETTWATVGVGVNLVVAPPLPGGQAATSLTECIGPGDAGQWLKALATGFVRRLTAGIADPTEAIETWRRELMHRAGDPLMIRLASGEVFSGAFAGVTSEGFLRLDQNGAERVVTGGDVVEL